MHSQRLKFTDTVRQEGSFDYQKFDKPALLRKQQIEQMKEYKEEKKLPENDDVDYLDIPAFLRRQEESVED